MPLSFSSKYLTLGTLVDIGELWAHFAGVFGNSGNLFCTSVVLHAWMSGMETFLSLLWAAVWQCPLQLFPLTYLFSSAFADSLVIATRFEVRDRKMLKILLASNFDELGK